MAEKWEPLKRTLRYVLARCVFSDWAGSGYVFARGRRGRVMKFWTLAGAQAAADRLNTKENGHG